jgi:Carboxypeptidase regulatory-like domain
VAASSLTMRLSSTGAWLLLASTTIATAADAQRIGGVVRDSISREPVAGAVVLLFDSAGRELERNITGHDGRYRLDALPAGRALRVLRIGFRPRTLTFPTGMARDTALDVVLAHLPTLLEAISVRDQPQCGRRSDRAVALALWEQARAALLATVVAREARPPTITGISYDRTVDRRGRILRQNVHHDSLPTNRPFIAARPVAEFRDHGYGEGVASQRTYFAPDADALLDPSFGDGHCFSLRQDKDKHSGQIGLAFEPTRDRSGVVDISGVLWLDVANPSLRTLEFRYTNVERVVMDAGAGGVVSFRTATNGLSLIDRWNLHLPSIEATVDSRRVIERPSAGVGPIGAIGRPTEPGWRVTDVHDIGAVIATARWQDGSEWQSELGTLRGRAVRPDSSTGVRGALVWLIGSDDSTRTAEDGSFELPLLLPGPYPLFAAESHADHFVFQQNDPLRLEVASAEMRPLVVVTPMLDARIKALCKKGVVSGPGPILMLGQVLLPDGSRASGAAIEALWAQSNNDLGHGFREHARADTAGSFHVCGLVADDTVHLTATLDSLDALATDLFHPHADSILFRIILRLAIPAFRSRTMRVVDEQDEPIRGASLLDDQTSEVRATTNANGEANLSWLPRGRTTVPVLSEGYRPTSITINVAPNDTTIVTVPLRRAP